MIKFCGITLPNFSNIEQLVVNSVTTTGKLSNFGYLYDKAVDLLSEYLGLDNEHSLVLTTSGHTALMAAYHVLNSKTIAMPAYTFVSTYQAAMLQNKSVIFIDVDVNTGCIEAQNILEESVTDTITTVCALSTIPDLESLGTLCKRQNKKLVIDGASTFGTPGIYNYGDAYCMSFHATKTLPVGECGVLILKKDLIPLAKQYINFGLLNRIPTDYGLNAKVSEYTVAILIDLLTNASAIIEKRQENLEFYQNFLGSYIPKSHNNNTVYQMLPLFFKTAEHATAARDIYSQVVETLQYYIPLAKLTNTVDLFDRNVCLPIHQNLTLQDLNIIKDATMRLFDIIK